MIRHLVLVNFKDDVATDTVADLMAGLEQLRGHLGGITDFQHGENVSPETDLIHGFGYAFWFDFSDAAARDAYLVDPQHQAAGAKLVAHARGGLDGLIVLDMAL